MLLPLAAFVLFIALYTYRFFSKLPKIPRAGRDGVLGYFLTCFTYVLHADELVKEGYDKYGKHGHPYLVPTLGGPIIFLGRQHLDKLKMSDDTCYNQPIAVNEALQLDHTMNSEQQGNPYQATVVKTSITRSISTWIPDFLDESMLAIGELLKPENGASSKEITIFDNFANTVARISGRVMTGKTLCRNKDYIHAVVHFAEMLVAKAQLLLWFPAISRPLVASVLTALLGGPKPAQKLLVPYLEKRLQHLEEGNSPSLVADFLAERAPDHECKDLSLLAMRVLNLNFGSIHTSTIIMTHSLYHLAELPESEIQRIRKEIIGALSAEGGFNKASISKFHLIDSLMRECGRKYGLGHVLMGRLLMKDVTLDDGAKLPAGFVVGLSDRSIHYDESIYENPQEFQYDRFVQMRQKEDNPLKFGFTTVEDSFLLFSVGKHSCPGRFFASAELRVMLGYIIMFYDLSFADKNQKQAPSPLRLNGTVIPDPKGKLVFTRREKVEGEDLFRPAQA